LPYTLEHAAQIELQIETHSPGEAMITLGLADDVYLRSYTRARAHPGISLPV
jgi:hypothetical protein